MQLLVVMGEIEWNGPSKNAARRLWEEAQLFLQQCGHNQGMRELMHYTWAAAELREGGSAVRANQIVKAGLRECASGSLKLLQAEVRPSS